jgi:hypothetical protein
MAIILRSVSWSPLQLECLSASLGGQRRARQTSRTSLALGSPPVSQPEHELATRTLAGQPHLNLSLIPLHGRLSWSKSKMDADYQVMRFYQTAIRTLSLASSNVTVSRLSSVRNKVRQPLMLPVMK